MKKKIMKQYCFDKCHDKGECKEAPKCDPYQHISRLVDELIDSCPKGCKIVGQMPQEPDCESPDVANWKQQMKSEA